ncbi:hypothetical protein B7Y94_04730 [Candidatus Saccharibacteria bacterium 32-49-12]|nr:MAG: hypothetical protein B7Y94_04730 [Candidatus Saccharibacteria bacterium 32-49-12]
MKNSLLTRTLWGISIIALGAGFLLDSLGALDFNSIVATYWPVIIILVGVIIFVSNPRHFLLPSFLAIIGSLFLLDNLDIINDVDTWNLVWPVAIVLIGLSILFRGQASVEKNTTKDERSELHAAFAGIENHVTSRDYKGGSLSAIFGGIALDLTKADIKDAANLDILAICGGVELRVPENWRVEIAGTPILGGWENKTVKPTSEKAPTLKISVTCIMGGLEIKN